MKRGSTVKRPDSPVTDSPLLRRLFDPVDVASIAFFRAAFGLLMLWHILQYFVRGWLQSSYLRPVFLFK